MSEPVPTTFEENAAAIGHAEIKIEPFVRPDGVPMLRLTFAGKVVEVNLFRARGWAAEVFMKCEHAESIAFVKAFFAKARDKALADGIVAKMLPAMEKAREEELGRWAEAMLKLGDAV